MSEQEEDRLIRQVLADEAMVAQYKLDCILADGPDDESRSNWERRAQEAAIVAAALKIRWLSLLRRPYTTGGKRLNPAE